MDIPIDKPLVLVTWLDAKDGQTGWHSIDDIEAKTEEEARKLLVKEGGLSILADDTLVDTHDYEKAELVDES